MESHSLIWIEIIQPYPESAGCVLCAGAGGAEGGVSESAGGPGAGLTRGSVGSERIRSCPNIFLTCRPHQSNTHTPHQAGGQKTWTLLVQQVDMLAEGGLKPALT